jgi:hypothetical protein
MADNFDKRVTAARPDIAAMHLKGKVDAARFVEGETVSVGIGRMSLHSKPTYPSEQVSEILYGETFTIYERGNGWSWGQVDSDGYVGYVIGGLMDAFDGPSTANARVTALMAPVYATPNIKACTFDFLPLNAVVRDKIQDGDFVEIRPHSFVHRRHLGPIAPSEADFVAIAERFLGAPYVWGGKTAAGLDCSGLIQTALQAIGKAAPRDTDMMEKILGEAIALPEIRRGDLIFWKGHMGVMLDEKRLLHANAFHMAVAIEPVAEAIARIEKAAGPVTSIKRL